MGVPLITQSAGMHGTMGLVKATKSALLATLALGVASLPVLQAGTQQNWEWAQSAQNWEWAAAASNWEWAASAANWEWAAATNNWEWAATTDAPLGDA